MKSWLFRSRSLLCYASYYLPRAQFTASSCSSAASPGPLSGIRVIDLSRILAGPFCTQLLGDLSAEIIKIEEPEHGDDTRHWQPPTHRGLSTYFIAANRNKKSIGINIKSAAGQEIIKELVKKSDVLVENYIPGKLAEFGLDYPALSAINPRLIYCSISGYGASGPYSGRPGYDVMASALGGLMGITGTPQEPAKVGVAITDVATALYTAGAINAALFHRERTGQGQKIETSLLSTAVANLVNIGQNYLSAGLEAQRLGTAHESIVPYQAFSCQNGQKIIAGALNDRQFQRFCAALQLETVAKDAKFANNPLRVKNRAELLELLEGKFREKSAEHWLEALERAEVPCAPVNNLEAVFKDEQVKYSGIVRSINHSDPQIGPISVLGPPVSYSLTPAEVQREPPLLSQHTVEILENILGYSQHKIEQLRRDKVIGLPKQH
jgi:succinate--hydroxymethylglutarate CoA-transferase